MVDFNKLVNGLSNSGIAPGIAGGLASGALVGALGSKGGRKVAGNVLKVGGIAAVGGLAWKAYQNYKDSNAAPRVEQAEQVSPVPAEPAAWHQLEQKQFEEIAVQQEESSGLLILRAMIAAAMADGVLTPEEQAKIFSRLDSLELSQEERALLFDELRQPKSVAEISAGVTDPALAIEIYTASRLAIDPECDLGSGHLDQLANALGLPEALLVSLNGQQVSAAA